MCGKCFQLQIVDVKLQLVGQFDCVYDEVNWEFGFGDFGFCSEKCIVECDIVCDQSVFVQYVDNFIGDIGELWLVIEYGGGQVVYVGGVWVYFGIQQVDYGLFQLVGGVQVEYCKVDDLGLVWLKV